jgi:hypothetical protein
MPDPIPPGDGSAAKKREEDITRYEQILGGGPQPGSRGGETAPHGMGEQQQDAMIQGAYRSLYSDTLREKIEKKGLDENFKTFLKMRNFPDRFDAAQIDNFIGELQEMIANEDNKDLAAALEKEEQEYKERIYKEGFSESARDLFEQHGLTEKLKNATARQNFPRYTTRERDEAQNEVNMALAANPELQEVVEQEGFVYERYNSLPEPIRNLYERFDLVDETKTAIKMQAFPDKFDQAQKDEFTIHHAQKIEGVFKAHPEIIEELGGEDGPGVKMLRQTIEEAKKRKGKAGEDDGEADDGLKQKYEKDPDAYSVDKDELEKEMKAAVQASIDDPLDVDKQKAAAEAMRRNQEHNEKYGHLGAEGIGGKEPWWTYALRTLGVLYYIYVGMAWVAAAGLENYGRSGGGGGGGKHG